MRKPSTRKTNALKKDISLMGVLANGNTAGCRKVLAKYGEPDAINHEDLEYKMAQLYRKSDDKIVLEKELAEIHPHKDFILNNLSKKEDVMPEPDPVVIEKSSGVIIEEANKQKTSCACGCSNAEGVTANSSSTPVRFDNNVVVLGVLGIITIFAMMVITTKRSA